MPMRRSPSRARSAPEVFSRVFPSGGKAGRNRIIEFGDARGTDRRLRPSSVRSFVATTGYTGELGFEVIVPAREAAHSIGISSSTPVRRPCGLGARDTLRLEMCYPLNGSDFHRNTRPSKPGSARSLTLARSLPRPRLLSSSKKPRAFQSKLSAIRVQEKSPPIRSHYAVLSEGRKVAETTSGALSPSSGLRNRAWPIFRSRLPR